MIQIRKYKNKKYYLKKKGFVTPEKFKLLVMKQRNFVVRDIDGNDVTNEALWNAVSSLGVFSKLCPRKILKEL